MPRHPSPHTLTHQVAWDAATRHFRLLNNHASANISAIFEGLIILMILGGIIGILGPFGLPVVAGGFAGAAIGLAAGLVIFSGALLFKVCCGALCNKLFGKSYDVSAHAEIVHIESPRGSTSNTINTRKYARSTIRRRSSDSPQPPPVCSVCGNRGVLRGPGGAAGAGAQICSNPKAHRAAYGTG